jgi:hypothetical protein
MLYRNPAGIEYHVSIVLSGQERTSIHRPQRCLTGQGHTIVRSRILGAPLPDGDEVQVKLLETEQSLPAPEGQTRLRNTFYAYWFVGQGRETPLHNTRMFWLGWDRVVHSVAHRWAYVSVSGARSADSEEYLDALRPFLGLLREAIVLEKQDERVPLS